MPEKNRKIMTLVIIHDHPRVLLGMKKRGFGVGRWNGFGGKVVEGEEIEQAAIRELREEAGIEVEYLEKVGVNEFKWKDREEELEVHIFKSRDFSGRLEESDEMSPKWFFIDEIPFSEMWSDDVYWFPYFMRGKKFQGKFIFDEKDKIVEYSLKEVNGL